MKPFTRFVFVSLFIVLTRLYDAYCTYQYTPDLKHEANPLVTFLGLGWGGLFVVIGGLVVYIIHTYYVALFKTDDFLPREGSYTFGQFTAYLYFGRVEHWIAFLYKLPSSLKRFNQYMGMMMPSLLVFAGVVSTIMWLLINNIPNYMQNYHSATVIYIILVLGSTLITLYWNFKLWKTYHEKAAFAESSITSTKLSSGAV